MRGFRKDCFKKEIFLRGVDNPRQKEYQCSMKELFAAEYHGQRFQFLGIPHLTVLGLVLFVNIFLFFRGKHFSPGARLRVRYVTATLLLANEIGYHLWRISTDTWTIQRMLPLHLCSALVWLSVVMLYTNSKRIYEYVYFLGIAGAAQALLTPEAAQYGFPHYRWCQTFLSHAILVTAPMYMTVVEGFRPDWRSYFRTILATNVYMLFVGLVNWLVGGNYLYIARKPDIPTLLDLLGPWPVYILAMEAIGLTLCLLLYLPFAFKDRMSENRLHQQEPRIHMNTHQ